MKKGKSEVSIEIHGKNSRRSTLKALAAGSAIVGTFSAPRQWTKPVVNAVTLPAHATTTNALQNFSGSSTISLVHNDEQNKHFLEVFASEAYAQSASADVQVFAQQIAADSFNFQVKFIELPSCGGPIVDGPPVDSTGRAVGFAAGPIFGGSGSLSSPFCPGTSFSSTFTVDVDYQQLPNSVAVTLTIFGALLAQFDLSPGGSALSAEACIDCPPLEGQF